MYPVLIRRVADLRVGDLLIAHSGIRYKNPLRVVGGAHGGGVVVAVQHPGGDDPSELVLQPWSTDGLAPGVNPDVGCLWILMSVGRT